MNPLRILLLVLGLVVVGGGVWLLVSEQPPVVTTPEPSSTARPEPEGGTADSGALQVASQDKPKAATTQQRTEVEVDTSAKQAPQGVKGQVVAPTGAPVAACKVYLLEATTGPDIFKMMQLAQRGITLPPVSSTETDERGNFALGVEMHDPSKVYEVRVVSDDFADLTHPNVRLQPSEWYDAKVLQLQNGLTLTGQVTVAGGGALPIADAEVSIKSSSSPFNVSLVPGRERGIVVKTDAGGFYRATNVPPGVHEVAAVAPGYARLVHSNVTVNEQNENRLNFELAQGQAIEGKVIDTNGVGIARARITAVAMSSKTPVTADDFADENGNFTILGLIEGPYQLTAKAEGFVDANEKPIMAGTKGLELVVEKQGGVRLTVVGKNGQLVREYTVTVKKYFPGQTNQPQVASTATAPAAMEASYGNTNIPAQNVRNPKDGVALIEGLDPDTYALQINARGYAMAFSDPFTVAVDTEPAMITVMLNEGGVIAGQVVAPGGQPLAGANVETRPNDLDDNPFTVMFAGMIPTKVTRTQVQTDPEGRFEIKLLNPGRYQLKVTHPEYVEVYKKDNDVVVGQTLNLPPIVMAPGCILSGVVRVDGQASAQVKVTVSSKTDPNAPPPRVSGFQCEAYTDNEGRYVMTKRLPPGLYEVMAAQQNLANPLLQIVQFQRSKQEVSVGAQPSFVMDFNLESLK